MIHKFIYLRFNKYKLVLNYIEYLFILILLLNLALSIYVIIRQLWTLDIVTILYNNNQANFVVVDRASNDYAFFLY